MSEFSNHELEGEFDAENPWAGISALDVQKAVDRSTAAEVASFKDILLAVIEGRKLREEAEECLHNEGSEEILTRFADCPPSWAIRCYVSHSRSMGYTAQKARRSVPHLGLANSNSPAAFLFVLDVTVHFESSSRRLPHQRRGNR